MKFKRIYFDTETTGLHPGRGEGDEIITLSIVDDDGKVLHDATYRPRWNSEWPEAEAVHGISPDDVANLPTIEADLPKIAKIFDVADEVCGYNVEFDLRFLDAVGIAPREDAEVIDTMQLYAPFHGDWSDYYEDYKWCKLTVAADEIGYEWTGSAHGSLADTLATKAVQEWIEGERVRAASGYGMSELVDFQVAHRRKEPVEGETAYAVHRSTSWQGIDDDRRPTEETNEDWWYFESLPAAIIMLDCLRFETWYPAIEIDERKEVSRWRLRVQPNFEIVCEAMKVTRRDGEIVPTPDQPFCKSPYDLI